MGFYDAMGWVLAFKRLSHPGPWYRMGLWNKGLFLCICGMDVECTESWMRAELFQCVILTKDKGKDSKKSQKRRLYEDEGPEYSYDFIKQRTVNARDKMLFLKVNKVGLTL